jgi:hypothetical protein
VKGTEFAGLVMQIVNSRGDDNSRQHRAYKKEKVCAVEHAFVDKQVVAAMNFVVGQAIADDAKYAKQTGFISRSYRASGTFAATEFDMHIPLEVNASMFTLCTHVLRSCNEQSPFTVVQDHRLPLVGVQATGKQRSAQWMSVLTNAFVSAERVRTDLRQRISAKVREWNDTNGQQHGSECAAYMGHAALVYSHVGARAGRWSRSTRRTSDCVVHIAR